RRRSRRIGIGAATALTLVAVGIGIGSRIAAPSESTPFAASPSSIPEGHASARPSRAEGLSSARTRAGAVTAAARSITTFDGHVLLDRAHLRTVVTQIASTAARPKLLAAFSEASAQTRVKLAVDTVPRPVIVLRSIPIGYRIEHFSETEVTVAVWYVG